MNVTQQMPPENDLDRAQRVGVMFQVATKAARGRPWTHVGEATGLSEAFALANQLDAYEVGLLKVTREALEFLYWSSRYPTVFNSSVIEDVPADD